MKDYITAASKMDGGSYDTLNYASKFNLITNIFFCHQIFKVSKPLAYDCKLETTLNHSVDRFLRTSCI